MSFSEDLRSELVERLRHSTADRAVLRSLVFHASAAPFEQGGVIETRHGPYGDFLQDVLAEDGWRDQSTGRIRRFAVSVPYPLRPALDWLRQDSSAETSDAFALLYAACGSMSEPARAAHLEYRLKNQVLAALFLQSLARRGLVLRTLPQAKHVRLYSKDSQTIGDLLISSGATVAYIRYSQLKVDKEVLNNVNRQVNCDQANARRVAESSADQADAIRRLDAAIGLGTLPETLASAARARLAHPDLSLAELGAVIEPPLGKSGMNHRLKKLLDLAADLEP